MIVTLCTIVRLANGPTKYEGRVEVHHNGEWGTVCDDGWDLNDAQIICKELKFGPGVATRHNAFYGEGSGKIWLDDLNCVGTEKSIRKCSHRGWGIENCSHSEDAGVRCSGGKLVVPIVILYIRMYIRMYNNAEVGVVTEFI